MTASRRRRSFLPHRRRSRPERYRNYETRDHRRGHLAPGLLDSHCPRAGPRGHVHLRRRVGPPGGVRAEVRRGHEGPSRLQDAGGDVAAGRRGDYPRLRLGHAHHQGPAVCGGRQGRAAGQAPRGQSPRVRKIRDWAAAGVRITGGSTLRLCHEVTDYLARPPTERGTPHTVLCGCAVDEFNYAIHAYAMLFAIMGHGARACGTSPRAPSGESW